MIEWIPMDRQTPSNGEEVIGCHLFDSNAAIYHVCLYWGDKGWESSASGEYLKGAYVPTHWARLAPPESKGGTDDG